MGERIREGEEEGRPRRFFLGQGVTLVASTWLPSTWRFLDGPFGRTTRSDVTIYTVYSITTNSTWHYVSRQLTVTCHSVTEGAIDSLHESAKPMACSGSGFGSLVGSWSQAPTDPNAPLSQGQQERKISMIKFRRIGAHRLCGCLRLLCTLIKTLFASFSHYIS
jgi:hypothetical protein